MGSCVEDGFSRESGVRKQDREGLSKDVVSLKSSLSLGTKGALEGGLYH
jgi:hypothetical protein